MTAQQAAERWCDAASATREHFARALLAREEVRVFVEAYQGNRHTSRVIEAARAAGVGLDDVDAGLVAFLVRHRAPVGVSEGRVSHRAAVQRWVEAGPQLRQEYFSHLLARDDVAVFVEAFAGAPSKAFGAAQAALQVDEPDAALVAYVIAARAQAKAAGVRVDGVDAMLFAAGPWIEEANAAARAAGVKVTGS